MDGLSYTRITEFAESLASRRCAVWDRWALYSAMQILRPAFLAAALQMLLTTGCATHPVGKIELPAETTLNKEAGQGGYVIVALHLESGKEVGCILDTGSSFTILDRSLAAQLGKRLGTETLPQAYHGRVNVGIYGAPKVYLGKTRLQIGDRVRTGFCNILGMDCLRHYCVQIDFTEGKIRFLDPDYPNTKNCGEAFPLRISPFTGLPTIHETFMGVQGGTWLIDTGCDVDGALKPKAFERALHQQHALPTQDRVNSNRGSGPVAARFPNARFDSETYTNLIFAKWPSHDWSAKNIIGLRFLARHLVTFDFPKRTLYLKRTGGGPLQDEDQP